MPASPAPRPARLYSPVIMDPVWGYEAINVEAQQSDPSSLLHWMRNMIALRKLFRVFGRGTLEFLQPRRTARFWRICGATRANRFLCVANLSRFAQPVDLDLSKLEGMIPVEMLGYVEFPTIERQPYRLTLAPYSFLWLELQRKPEAVEPADSVKHVPFNVTSGWDSVLDGASRERLESMDLQDYLPRQRWFGGKTRRISGAKILDAAEVQPARSALALVEVDFETGIPETYQLPLAMTFGDLGEDLRRVAPVAGIASIVSNGASGLLHDGVYDDQLCARLLSLIEQSASVEMRHGRIRGIRGAAFDEISGGPSARLAVRRGSAEQSNTSIVFGDRFILKLFRRLESGVNPDCEIGRYLTEKAKFSGVAPFAGSIEYVPNEGGEPATLAMLQGLVPNEGDGWKLTVEELDRYYESCSAVAFPENVSTADDALDLSERSASRLARDHVGIYLDSAAALGRRTAAMHIALASATDDPDFAPEPLTSEDLQALLTDAHEHAAAVFEVLKTRVSHLPDEVVEIAASVLSRRSGILDALGSVKFEALRAQRIRIHGDYHLGQVLRVKTDFVILDFEGEPARPLAYRRSKQCPLKDVAGMLRSFSYAAQGTLINYAARHPESLERLEPWAQLWERSVAAEFLRTYRETSGGANFLPAQRSDFRKLLDVFLLDKALYEILYEMNSRPGWVRIPMQGLLSLPL